MQGMARRRSFLSSVQRDSYQLSRATGDVRAAQRGQLVKRLVRRRVTRGLFRALGL